jgi:hypothetical protein
LDDAIRVAAKTAIDVGDMQRAHALIDLLGATKQNANVLDLTRRRR